MFSSQTLKIGLIIMFVILIVWHIKSMMADAKAKEQVDEKYASCLQQVKNCTPCRQNTGATLEEHKQPLNPESFIMDEHVVGDKVDIQKIDDPLTLDGLLQRSKETQQEALMRSMVPDGPLLEGTYDPADARERNAMERQLAKKQEIYGSQNYDISEADKLSELNI